MRQPESKGGLCAEGHHGAREQLGTTCGSSFSGSPQQKSNPSPRFTIDRALAKEQRFRGQSIHLGMSVQARARHRMPQAGGLR